MSLSVAFFSFISALFGAMGFGGGSVLIIYLISIGGIAQTKAQGINLVFFLATGAFALTSNAKKGLVDKEAFKKLLLPALSGLASGLILLPFIPADLLKKLFGGALLILGLKELFSKENKQERRR